MKPNWTQDAAWQFIGVVLSALGIFVALLPDNQRFWGFAVSIIGVSILSWLLLRKPAKRITQQLTRRKRSSLKWESYSDPRLNRDWSNTPKDTNIQDGVKHTRMSRSKIIFRFILFLALITLAASEFFFIHQYVNSLAPKSATLFYGFGANPDPLLVDANKEISDWYARYDSLYSYAKISEIAVDITFCVINIFISIIVDNTFDYIEIFFKGAFSKRWDP